MNSTPESYAFGDFCLDALKRRLTKGDGDFVQLPPKAFDTLLYLVRNPGKVVEKEELMSVIWADTIVEENNLNQSISAIRRALGERPDDHRFVVTIPGRGYKFVAAIREVPDGGAHSLKDRPLPSKAESTPGVESRPGSRAWIAGLALLAVVAAVLGAFYVRQGNTDPSDATPIKTLTILPFKPLVAENRNEALELGMADTLIAKLSRLDQIAVRPLESVRRLASLEKDSITVARELQTEAVLDGSIQTAGDRIRISARLFRVADGKQLWAGQFDENLTDIFAVQDSISEKVAAALHATLQGRQKRNETQNLEAYQLYVAGRYHASKLTRDEIEIAIESYNKAIALDPNYALAHVGLSRAYRSFSLTSDLSSMDTMPKAKAAALRAIELDNSEPEAHTALGLIAFLYDWDWKLAERHYLRALELDPNNSNSHAGYAHLLSNTGRHDQALAEMRRARELDPLSISRLVIEGQIFHYAAKYDEALEQMKRTIEVDSDFWLAQLVVSRIYEQKGMHDDATEAAEKAWQLSKVNTESLACQAYSLARGGRTGEARAILAQLTDLSLSRYVPPYSFALVHKGLGENEKALDYLEKGIAEKDVRMVFLKVDPKWNDLRSEPRFMELMRVMNFL